MNGLNTVHSEPPMTSVEPASDSPKPFHVFLSHNSADKPAVEELARRLKVEGIEPWFDRWHLIPGEPWQQALERALADSATVAVFVGPSGFGPWQNEEMRAALARRVGESTGGFRVIPVLLPGGTREERSRLPTFLVASTWVEFRKSLDEEDAYHRLKAGIRGQAPGTAPGEAVYEGQCPYRGLKAFQAEHAAFFFGREARIEWLLNELRPATTSGSGEPSRENRFLGIIGASGSGKSSLARAGLVPALRQGRLDGSADWPIVICRPGNDPLESLATALAADATIGPRIGDVGDLIKRLEADETRLHLTTRVALGNGPESQRVVVVVDQFEELFTLSTDSSAKTRATLDPAESQSGESRRKSFIDNLVFAAGIPGGKTIVVLTMRADFYGKCASYANLAAALSEHQDLVGPMTQSELREVIERPAQLVGLELEPGLTEMLLQDMQNQPGALPLLQHALWELWQRREGRRLTVAAYKAIGQLEGALEKQANEVFDALSPVEQETCRRLFLRLTQPGEGSEDTKCRVAVSQVGDSAATVSIIQRLTNVRLITTEGQLSRPDEAFIEVSHEALIRKWSKLRGWIDADREALRTQHRLTEAANEWNESERDAGYLYQGARLAETEEWSQTETADLTSLEKEFLAASLGQRDRGKREEELRKARELETLKQLAVSEHERASEQTAAARRSQRLSFMALGLTVIAVGAFVWAFLAQREAVKYASETTQAKQNVDEARKKIEEEYAQNLLERIDLDPGNFGANEFPGLWQIASQPKEWESIRSLILAIGLKNDDAAARMANRAPYLAQALIGLDSDRRKKFLDEIKRALQQTTSPAVRLACVRLGIALRLEDPEFEFATQAVDILSTAMVDESTNAAMDDALAEDLRAAVRLFPNSGSADSVQPIIEAMQKIPDARVLRLLCDALAGTPHRIEKPADGRLIVDRLLTVMENDPEKGTRLEMLQELRLSLKSLPTNLEIVDIERGSQLFVQLITNSGSPEIHDSLVEIVESAAPLLTESQCPQFMESFRKAMSEAQDTQDAQTFARCVNAVATRLAQQDTPRAVELLMAAMQTSQEAESLQTLSTGLSKLPGTLPESAGRTAIEMLLKQMNETTQSGRLRLLAESLALFPTLLSRDDLAKATAKLLSQIQPERLPPELKEVAQSLAALPISLSPAESLPPVNVLIDGLKRSTKPETHLQLQTALQLLAGKMTPEAAMQAAEPILEAMAKSDATEKILVLAYGLRGMDRDGKSLLSEETVRKAYQIVLSKLHDKNDRYFALPINLAVLAQCLAVLPGNTPEDVANEAIGQLLDALVRTDNSETLHFLVNGLGYVGGNLSVDVGHQAIRRIVETIKGEHSTRLKRVQILALAAVSIEMERSGKFQDADASDVVAHLVYALNVTTDNSIKLGQRAMPQDANASDLNPRIDYSMSVPAPNTAFRRLAEALTLIAPKLPGDGEDSMRKVVRRIRIALQSTKDPAVMDWLAQGLTALAERKRMTEQETREALGQILAKMRDPASGAALPSLTNAAASMVRSFELSQLMYSLDRALTALESDLEPELLDFFLGGIKKLAELVDPGDVDKAKIRIIAVTTEPSHVNDQIMNGLILALDARRGFCPSQPR